MKITIEITCDNAAFEEDLEGEVQTVLDRAMAKFHVLLRDESVRLVDSNGNKIGKMTLESDE